MKTAKIAPSILTADFANLGRMFEVFEKHPSVGYIHMDVMDGAFVPNISFGPPVIKSLAGKTRIPFDVHLMVNDPGRYIENFVTENTEYITVHAEACIHLDRVLRQIRQAGAKSGVALNPATPPEVIDYVLDIVDQVLVMSVNPGFGGQSFIQSSFAKIDKLKEMRERRGLDFKLAIDGGINKKNVLDVEAAGVEIIVIGSAILNAEDPGVELAAYDGM